MISRISIKDVFNGHPDLPVVDVRTPAEFADGHIPGAVNIPLFSNDERAHVGTVYKKQSREKAIELGYRYVEPKLESYLMEARKAAPEGRLVVHCWRGGMRSEAFAGHLHDNGFSEVYVIEGGYKAFRREALAAFEAPSTLLIIGGYTGSGKSKIIDKLREMGEQVVDLEGLAKHRGSAFGGIGQGTQPTTEHFANLLYCEWRTLDPARPIWLEDESMRIGMVNIPEHLFTRMRESELLFLDIPQEERVKFLVEEYANLDREQLAAATGRIAKRLGGVRTEEALEALENGEYGTTARITLDYYDKAYLKGMRSRVPEKVTVVEAHTVDAKANAEKLVSIIQSYGKR